MTNGARQMTAHVEAAYKDAVENINFLKRQQWVATNYAVLVYAAIFVISGTYFSRTDFARNMLGIVTLVTFVIHFFAALHMSPHGTNETHDSSRWRAVPLLWGWRGIDAPVFLKTGLRT